jgi:hypothetical protein
MHHEGRALAIRSLLIGLSAGLSAGSGLAADSGVSVKDLGQHQYELTLTTNTTTSIAVAQVQLLPTAKQTCGNEEVHFGHYSFHISQPLSGSEDKMTKFTLTQTIRCGSETPITIPQSTHAPDGWKPSAVDQSQIETQTYAYYSAKDAGDFTSAYAMFDRGMKDAAHFDSWSDHAKAQNAKAGPIRGRRIIRITWYKDPPSAPEPGVYAAADFAGQYENDPIYCGYLAWHRGPDGTYRIAREEENFIDKGSIARMSQTEVNALATKMGCPTTQ